MYLRAHLAPNFTNFEGGGSAPRKRDFLVKIFQKVPKNASSGFFFKNLPAAQIICSKWGLYSDLGEQQQRSTKLSNFQFFLKFAPSSTKS